MSDERKNWLDKSGLTHLWTIIRSMLDSKVDKRDGMGLSSNDYTKLEKEQLKNLVGHNHNDLYYSKSDMDSRLEGKSDVGHTHDDRYYTEAEMDTKLTGKANSSHTHDSVKDIGNNSSNTTFAYSKSGLAYGNYSWLAGWNGYELRAVDKTQFAASSHTHNYAGSGSAGGTANSVNGFTIVAQSSDPGADSALATNKILLVYKMVKEVDI